MYTENWPVASLVYRMWQKIENKRKEEQKYN